MHLVGRRPALDEAADDVEFVLQAHRRRVMQRARNGGAAAPAVPGRIVHFEFALAAEPADNVDFLAHLGHRHLGAGGGHWGADGPTASALGESRGNEQGTAGRPAEQRDKLAPPQLIELHSVPSQGRIAG